MAHQRKLIRDAVVARLRAALEPSGVKIFSNRPESLWTEELPAVMVYTRREPVTVSNEAPREYRRELELEVEGVVRANAAVDDLMDSFSELIENIIHQDETWGGLASDTFLANTDQDLDAQGDKNHGFVKLTLQIIYYAYPSAVTDGALDDFLRMHTEVDVDPENTNNDVSKDDLELPQ